MVVFINGDKYAPGEMPEGEIGLYAVHRGEYESLVIHPESLDACDKY